MVGIFQTINMFRISLIFFVHINSFIYFSYLNVPPPHTKCRQGGMRFKHVQYIM